MENQGGEKDKVEDGFTGAGLVRSQTRGHKLGRISPKIAPYQPKLQATRFKDTKSNIAAIDVGIDGKC